MKLARLARVALLSISCCALAQTHSSQQAAASPGYTISVGGPDTPIKLGTRAIVMVTVQNISHQPVYWNSELGTDSAYHNFEFLLTRNSHEVKSTYFHRRISGKQRESDPVEAPGSGSSLSYLLIRRVKCSRSLSI
jgi:hypothetical protein